MSVLLSRIPVFWRCDSHLLSSLALLSFLLLPLEKETIKNRSRPRFGALGVSNLGNSVCHCLNAISSFALRTLKWQLIRVEAQRTSAQVDEAMPVHSISPGPVQSDSAATDVKL